MFDNLIISFVNHSHVTLYKYFYVRNESGKTEKSPQPSRAMLVFSEHLVH